MTTTENLLSENSILKIKEFISTELLKRGITAKIKILEEVSWGRGSRGLKLESESFQTTPVIFKEIRIINFNSSIRKVSVEEAKEFEVHQSENPYTFVWLGVNVNYENFTGGSNSTEIFTIHAKVYDNDHTVFEIK